MKAWFQRFMSGRYGVDPFSQFLSTAALILVILGLFLPGPLRLLGWLGWAALIYSYFRIFSRNIARRSAENRWFLEKRYAVQQRFGSAKTRFDQRKVYRYFRCPHCRQQLLVPRGRGRISITCPKCGTTFIKKS